MKRVIIVRHAKSVPYGYDNDFNRDLTERGEADAEKISLKLQEMGLLPDLVVSSPATRTMHTAAIFCRTLKYNQSAVQQEEDLYDGLTTQEFVDFLRKLPEKMQTIYVFGHNPTVYYLVYNLVKYFNSDMPTCSTVVLDFQVDKWDKVLARGAKIAFQLTPKNL